MVRPALPRRGRGRRRRPAGRRGHGRPRAWTLVRRGARLPGPPGLPQPASALPGDGRAARRHDPDRPAAPRFAHAGPRGQPRVRPRRQPGHEAGRGRGLLLLPARRRRPRPVHDQRARGRDLPFERRDRRAEAGRLGPSGRAPARRAQRRPRRRHPGDGRGRGARPGAARRGARRLLRPDGLPPRPDRPVPRARRLRPGHRLLRRRPGPVLAGPPVGRPRAGGPRRPRPPPPAPAGAPPGPRRARAVGASPPAHRAVGPDRLPPGRPVRAARALHDQRHGGRARQRPGPRGAGHARRLGVAAHTAAGSLHPSPPVPGHPPGVRRRGGEPPGCAGLGPAAQLPSSAGGRA